MTGRRATAGMYVQDCCCFCCPLSQLRLIVSCSMQGFRYIEVTVPHGMQIGPEEPGAVECYPMRTDVDVVANFSSSDPFLDQLRNLNRETGRRLSETILSHLDCIASCVAVKGSFSKSILGICCREHFRFKSYVSAE